MAIKVLFVCLGNICRSPMAEGVFRHMVQQAGLGDKVVVDSAGTGAWHVGERPHRGTQQVLAEHGIACSGYARQITQSDMSDLNTWIIAMDESNLLDIRSRFGNHIKLYRLLDFATDTAERNVPDPYYSGGFDYVYDLVVDGCQGLLQAVQGELTSKNP